jgi:lipid IVA palmitoyltransferase
MQGFNPNGSHSSRLPMPPQLRACAVLLLTLFAPFAASADETPSAWDRTLSALNSTTTVPLASKEEQDKGWFSGAWDGMKRLWHDGSSDLYLSGYYWHAPWNFTSYERSEYNDLALGGGYGRSLIDEKDNQRLLYAMIVQDSFRKPMYLAGYGWVARWKVAGDLRLGAGYTISIISNSKATSYIPFPAPTPLVSIGTDKVAVYGTYLNSIAYFFAKVTF